MSINATPLPDTDPVAAARRADMLRQLARPVAASPAPSPTPSTSWRWKPWALATLPVLAVLLAVAGQRPQGGWPWAAQLPAPLATAQAKPLASPSVPVVGVADGAMLPPAKLEASGFVTATRIATVSARTMGQVTEVLVDEGSRVQRGQVLARLGDVKAQTDWRLSQAQHQAALARVQSAQAQLRDAQRDHERERMLRDQNFTSDARLGKAQTTVETAEAALASAQADAALAALQVQRQMQAVDDHVVRAPFDGVVLARNAQVGEMVAPGGAGGGYTRTGICTIVDMSSLEIVVDVNEELINRVQTGQPVHAELYSHKGWRLNGEVLRVMPSADRAKATVRARIKLLTEDARILPDMAVKVFFL